MSLETSLNLRVAYVSYCCWRIREASFQLILACQEPVEGIGLGMEEKVVLGETVYIVLGEIVESCIVLGVFSPRETEI